MSLQKTDELLKLLIEGLVDQIIGSVNVMGINTLKTVVPPLATLEGLAIVGVDVNGRNISVTTDEYVLEFDLQRTGRVVLALPDAGASPPAATATTTVRIATTDGRMIDFQEPSRTKRITLRVSPRS